MARHALRLLQVLAICALAAPPTGCARRVVAARRLPDRWQAAEVTNAKVLDIGRLSVPVAKSSLIEPEDVVDVAINSGLEQAAQAAPVPIRVGADGVVSLALIGDVELAGLEPHDAEQRIATAAVERGIYKSPQVTVTMRKKAINQITVLGAVERPGVIEVPRSQSTLLAALVAAGTLSDKAGTVIEVRRNRERTDPLTAAEPGGARFASTDPEAGVPGLLPPQPRAAGGDDTVRIDLADIDETGRTSVQLGDGDVVRVETRDPLPVDVIGLVRNPGRYPLPPNQTVTVLDALALAGERSNPWADKIIVKRYVKGEAEPIVIAVSIMAAKRDDSSNIRLAPGDIVSVEETPQTVTYNVISTILRVNVFAGGNVPIF